MDDLKLTKIRLANGFWEGNIEGQAGARPEVEVLYRDKAVDGVELHLASDRKSWNIRIPLPRHALADGVQTFVIRDRVGDRKLGDFTLIAGEAAADDLRAEVDLLRAELDMLKRAFRRHCVETSAAG